MLLDHWPKIQIILSEALDLPSGERDAYLDAAELTPEYRAEIDALLSVEAEAESFMSVPAGPYSEDFFNDWLVSNDMTGREIGPYRIDKGIGSGGMGSVFRAVRCDGKFEQTVAIKLLRREFNAGRIRALFAREIAIHAKLTHPNVAKMLDTGISDGVPFIVMEYVDGVPIDSFCESNHLPFEARLKLFIRASDAVAFAHHNLVVHRDLKPSNILVTTDGIPKLLDFGISKLLDADGMETSALTSMGVLTPDYASPEQLGGQPVTTAADIYSLGVVLFKLVTQRLPYDLGTLPAREWSRRLGEIEPVQASVAAPAVLASTLRGDFDNIVRKTLATDPLERYRTVEQLVEDLWRFIDGMPVRARPLTLSYRLNKFVKRRKLPIAAAVLVVLSLFVGLGTAVWQADAARNQAAFAVAETEKARGEEAKAKKISKFMYRVLSYANPRWDTAGSRAGGQARVIDVMNELGGEIDIEFAGEHDIAAEIHHRFAEIYNFHRGEKSRELYHARRALVLRQSFYGERHELVAKDMFYLYTASGVEQEEWARYLMSAIKMMRETNPDNLNLAYMIESYSHHLIMPSREKHHAQFLIAADENRGETNFQIAERLLVEADRVYKIHYPEINVARANNECLLGFARLKQGKLVEAAPNIGACHENVPLHKDIAAFSEFIQKSEAGAGEH